eukprot:TRINITY_DN2779_c0_g1_i1.p1 TRINITY_DN2779_c0_g1~~TRINITY_DN2779_c0_g1_i1.p1  ORF type:complete len:1099 (-),score=155.77 TRINITY_DN2779_c0_g1_i1:49-3252(-)
MEASRLFDAVDRNGDGAIGREELAALKGRVPDTALQAMYDRLNDRSQSPRLRTTASVPPGRVAPTAQSLVPQGDAITGDELAAALRGDAGGFPSNQNMLPSARCNAATFTSMPALPRASSFRSASPPAAGPAGSAATMSMTALPASPPSVPRLTPTNVPPSAGFAVNVPVAAPSPIQNPQTAGPVGAATFSSMPAMTALSASPPSVPRLAPENVPPLTGVAVNVPLAAPSQIQIPQTAGPVPNFSVEGSPVTQSQQLATAGVYTPPHQPSPQLSSQTQISPESNAGAQFSIPGPSGAIVPTQQANVQLPSPQAPFTAISGEQTPPSIKTLPFQATPSMCMGAQEGAPPLPNTQTLPPPPPPPPQSLRPEALVAPATNPASGQAQFSIPSPSGAIVPTQQANVQFPSPQSPLTAISGQQTPPSIKTLPFQATPSMCMGAQEGALPLPNTQTLPPPPPPPPQSLRPEALVAPATNPASGQATQLTVQENQEIVLPTAQTEEIVEEGVFEENGDLFAHRGIDGELFDDGLSDLFSQVDTKEDGMITRDEFLRAVSEQRLLVDENRLHLGASEWKPGMTLGLGGEDTSIEGEVPWRDRVHGDGEFGTDQTIGFQGGRFDAPSGAGFNSGGFDAACGNRFDASGQSLDGPSGARFNSGRFDASAGRFDAACGNRFDASGPSFEGPSLGGRFDAPNARFGGPRIDSGDPSLHVDGFSGSFNGPEVDVGTPGVQFDGPSAKFDGSGGSMGLRERCFSYFMSCSPCCANSFCCCPCPRVSEPVSCTDCCLNACGGVGGDCGDAAEIWCVDSLHNCASWCFGRERVKSYGTTVSNIFPWLFTLLCVVLFASPIMQVSELAGDMQVRYWICGRLNVVLILPVLYAFTHFMHTMQGSPNRKLISVCLIGSCILLLVIGDYVLYVAKQKANALVSKDCSTFKQKEDLNQQWLNAEYFYKQCMNATARETGETANVAFTLYRIQDCKGYSEQVAINPDWPYLGALEHTYQCGGWCTRSEPLWTFKSVKDSCSMTVADSLLHRVQWCMTEVIGYVVVVLVLASIVLMQVGAIFRTYNIPWK